MTTDPAYGPLHLDHYHAVVQMNRCGRLQEIAAWFVHGDDQRALHALNLCSDEDLALAAIVGERVSSMAAEVLGARRVVGDEVGVVVVGAGAGRVL